MVFVEPSTFISKLNISFIVGMYAGVYVDQHYELPKIDDPKAMWKKIEEFAKKYKKENPGPSSKE